LINGIDTDTPSVGWVSSLEDVAEKAVEIVDRLVLLNLFAVLTDDSAGPSFELGDKGVL